MDCEQVREALSARIDGEEPAVTGAWPDSHLAACGDCAGWYARAQTLTRVVRLQPARVPDLTRDVLAAVAADPRVPAPRRRRSRAGVLRLALALVATVQVALAVPVLVGADLHVSREVASFEMALAVGFALAAWRPVRAAAFVPVAAVLAAGLAITAVADVATAQTAPAYEAGHAAVLVQAGLLWALAREHHPGGRSDGRGGTPAPVATAA